MPFIIVVVLIIIASLAFKLGERYGRGAMEAQMQVDVPKNFGHIPGTLLMTTNSDRSVEIAIRPPGRRHGSIEELGHFGRAYYDKNHYLTSLTFKSPEEMGEYIRQKGGFAEFPTVLFEEIQNQSSEETKSLPFLGNK